MSWDEHNCCTLPTFKPQITGYGEPAWKTVTYKQANGVTVSKHQADMVLSTYLDGMREGDGPCYMGQRGVRGSLVSVCDAGLVARIDPSLVGAESTVSRTSCRRSRVSSGLWEPSTSSWTTPTPS
jgi:hypothetical protein